MSDGDEDDVLDDDEDAEGNEMSDEEERRIDPADGVAYTLAAQHRSVY